MPGCPGIAVRRDCDGYQSLIGECTIAVGYLVGELICRGLAACGGFIAEGSSRAGDHLAKGWLFDNFHAGRGHVSFKIKVIGDDRDADRAATAHGAEGIIDGGRWAVFRSGEKQIRCRYWSAGPGSGGIPRQLDPRIASDFVILDTQIHRYPLSKGKRCREPVPLGMGHPVINDQSPIHPNPQTFITDPMENKIARSIGKEPPCPMSREVIDADPGIRRPIAPNQ